MDLRKKFTDILATKAASDIIGKGEIAVIEDTYTYREIQTMIPANGKSRSKNPYISAIKSIPIQGITMHGYRLLNSSRRQKEIIVDDFAGCFEVCFSDGSSMYFAKWYSGAGKLETINGLFAARKSVWINFIALKNRTIRKTIKPPAKGIFRLVIDSNTDELHYVKLDKLQEITTYSPAKQKVDEDMDFFFNNLKLFIRFNMSGIRKILLIGEPGTGKSSYCAEIARKHSQSQLVVFGTNIYEVAQHIRKTANYNQRSIVILEDADSSLQGARSSVLNFLDGIDQPVTKNGTYLIFTTNYPQQIEPRILKRPGRIDKIIHFGALEGIDAIDCARHYFEGLIDFELISKNGISEQLQKAFDGLTGAQIKELSHATASYVVGQKLEDLTIETIKFVRNQMMESLKEVQLLAEDTSLRQKRSMGFGSGF